MSICRLSFCWLFWLLPTLLSASDWANKIFPVKEHQFGVVARGAKAEYRFEFENPYKEELVIRGVRTSCGCTTVATTSQRIGSRQKAAIVATLNTTSYTGAKTATITIEFVQPFYAEVQLRVSGTIRTDLIMTPPDAFLGAIREGDSKEIQLAVKRLNRTDWRITDVRSACSDFKVSLSDPIIEQNSTKYVLTLRTLPTLAVGGIQQRVSLVTNDPDGSAVDIMVTGTVQPTLSVNPESVTLGKLSVDDNFSRQLIIRADRPFAIRSVACPDKRFTFDPSSESKKLHTLRMRFNAQGPAGTVAQQVRIVTDLPGDRYTEFLVTGEVIP